MYNKTNIEIDHADIVITHECMNHCPFCIDKFVHTSNNVVSETDVAKFMRKLKSVTDKDIEVLFLGGEPTCAGVDKLYVLANIVRSYGYSPIISTNNPSKQLVCELLPCFDWIQVTVHNDSQIDFYRQYKEKINVKWSGDQYMDIHKFNHFINSTVDFPRRSISMYFTPDFQELCTDKEVWKILDSLEWKRNGSYLYSFYKGVRIKRCINGETNIIDEPTVPKLYPNGNYNKTWNNEDLDDYLI